MRNKNLFLPRVLAVGVILSLLFSMVPIAGMGTEVRAQGTEVTDSNTANTIMGLPSRGSQRLNLSGIPESGTIFFAGATGTGSISGFVYESNGTTPIAGATVVAFDYGLLPMQAPPSGQATTDASGNYTITGLSTGDYRVSAVATGHERRYHQNTQFGQQAQPISVTSGQDTSGVNFNLGPGGTISGTVRNQNTGQPLAQVSVAAVFPSGPGSPFTDVAVSDQSGNYTLDGLSYGTYVIASPIPVRIGGYTIGSSDNGYVMEWWQEKAVPSPPDLVAVSQGVNPTGIDFTLVIGGTISGHVYKSDGATPISGATLNVFAYNSLTGGWVSHGTAITDAQGYYITTGHAAGQYGVRASAQGYANEWYNNTYDVGKAAPVSVTVPNDSPNINFTLEPGGTISGTVTAQATGLPLANVSVECGRVDGDGGAGATTNVSGNYTLTGLPFGPYKVNSPGGGRWGTGDGGYMTKYYNNKPDSNSADLVTISAGSANATGINFSLEIDGSISGVIRNADASVSLGNISVECRRLTDDPKNWHTATANSSGNYTISGLPDGQYEVRSPGGGRWGAGDDGYTTEYYNDKVSEATANLVTVSGGTNVTGIDFTLARGGSISGRVFQADGITPIPGANVNASDYASGVWLASAQTALDGSYFLDGILAGQVRVDAWATGRVHRYWQNTLTRRSRNQKSKSWG